MSFLYIDTMYPDHILPNYPFTHCYFRSPSCPLLLLCFLGDPIIYIEVTDKRTHTSASDCYVHTCTNSHPMQTCTHIHIYTYNTHIHTFTQREREGKEGAGVIPTFQNYAHVFAYTLKNMLKCSILNIF